MTVEDNTDICDGLGHAMGRSMGVLYAEYDLIGSKNQEWLQGTYNVLIGLFLWVGLIANVTKSKIFMCRPGTIRLVMSEEAMGCRSTGRGTTYQERLQRRLPCPD